MEFKLNQIDMELRQKVNDATSEGKIHSKQGIVISSEEQEDKDKNKGFDKQLKKYSSNKRKLTISASKQEKISIDAFMYKDNEEQKLSSPGVLIDIRK